MSRGAKLDLWSEAHCVGGGLMLMKQNVEQMQVRLEWLT